MPSNPPCGMAQLYGPTLVRDFGPLALKSVREKLIGHPIVRKIKTIDPATGEVREEEKLLAKGLARRNINKLVGRIKRGCSVGPSRTNCFPRKSTPPWGASRAYARARGKDGRNRESRRLPMVWSRRHCRTCRPSCGRWSRSIG